MTNACHALTQAPGAARSRQMVDVGGLLHGMQRVMERFTRPSADQVFPAPVNIEHIMYTSPHFTKHPLLPVRLWPRVKSRQVHKCGMSLCQVFSTPLDGQLAAAAAAGRTADVRRLVSEGADVNAVGDKRVTPLMWALVHGSTAGMSALLQTGADASMVRFRHPNAKFIRF